MRFAIAYLYIINVCNRLRSQPTKMLLNQIAAANKAPEKLILPVKCAFLALFLLVMMYFTMEAENKAIARPEKGFIQAPMKNTGGGSLQTQQTARSQRSLLFIAGGSN
jgi:hypothetical protein